MKTMPSWVIAPSCILSILLSSGGTIWYYRNNPIIETVTVTKSVVVAPATPKSSEHTAFTHDNLLIQLNEVRLAQGLNQLYDDSYLSDQAQKDLEENCPVTGHDNFRKLVDSKIFSRYTQVAEFLNSGESTPDRAIEAFLASPTHADGIVGKSWNWKYVGIGVSTYPTNCVSFILGK